MNATPSLISVDINDVKTYSALVDEGCLCYAVISENVARETKIPVYPLPGKKVKGPTADMGAVEVLGFTCLSLGIMGYIRPVYAYVVPRLDYPVILGKPWMLDDRIRSVPSEKRLWVGKGRFWVPHVGHEPAETPLMEDIRNAKQIHASTFLGHVRRIRKTLGKPAAETAVSAVKLADINKALAVKPLRSEQEVRKLLPPDLADLAPLFMRKEADKLAPHRPDTDLKIDLKKSSDGQEPPLPWGPLYNMSREELLVLKKTLTELLGKGFIRASSSSAGAPVLFVKKPGGGLRFCVDYRALNSITCPDRYPIPLLAETFRNLKGAKWFTKVDVVQAFHKIRIHKGDEHKTAFRTRYGLYEYIVVPFGLINAPATFQRYVNSVLREYLDDFVTAYMDDILIYTSGSRQDHMCKVRHVLERLHEAGLHLDLDKSEFAVKTVKYIGFVIHAGVGIQTDPEKIRAIVEWEAPTSLKGLRGFLGFCNFYRQFISNYSEVVAPLTSLTGKTPFHWDREQQEAFELLKSLFTRAPILTQWDPSRRTFLEADCSGFALGGQLSQDVNGERKPIAYYSRKLNKAEINYPIHDKELLAIIHCLKQWDAELRSCGRFTVLTDHRNLEHFMVKRSLSERQARWAECLSRYNMEVQYRPGKEAVVPDALSRKDQDKLTPEDHISREQQLIPDQMLPNYRAVNTVSFVSREVTCPLSDSSLSPQWKTAIENDSIYAAVHQAVQKGERALPPALQLKIQLNDCDISATGALRYRGRLWIPGNPVSTKEQAKNAPQTAESLDQLRTKLIQLTHDAAVNGHPGREGTVSTLSKDFYWPLLQLHVRRFLRNCDVCGRTKVWRDLKRGLLRPLPIPDQFHRHLQMDFMTELPLSRSCRFLWVIKDRLSGEVILEPMETMGAEACADRFLWCFARFHWWPKAVTSDRGSNWVSRFWKTFCRLIGCDQQLSTAYHPQTDGGPERMNQEVQAYLRAYINETQDDWAQWLPAAQMAINGRITSSTGLTPFFATHGYDPGPVIALRESEVVVDHTGSSPEKAAQDRLHQIQRITDLVQAARSEASQRQELAANRKRAAAEKLKVGDKVWLDLHHYRTHRPKKKLDWQYAKYTVSRVWDNFVELDGLPNGVERKFSLDKVRRAANDPLPGQVRDDLQPPAIMVDGEEEYAVEEVLRLRTKRVGRGTRREALVRWKGYHQPTWEPLHELRDTAALAKFERERDRAG